MNRFTPGRRFKSRGQRYEILGTKEHWTRDDRNVEMIRYRSTCAHPGCDRVFEAMTTKSRLRRGQLNKRCERHHAPGLPAPVEKERKAAIRKKTPGRPIAGPQEREIGRLSRPAGLVALRGQQPSYLE